MGAPSAADRHRTDAVSDPRLDAARALCGAPVFALVLGPDGTIRLASDEAAAALGHPADGLRGRALGELDLAAAVSAPVAELVTKALATGDTADATVEVPGTHGGAARWLLLRAAPEPPGPPDGIRHVVVVAADVSELQRSRDALRAAYERQAEATELRDAVNALAVHLASAGEHEAERAVSEALAGAVEAFGLPWHVVTWLDPDGNPAGSTWWATDDAVLAELAGLDPGNLRAWPTFAEHFARGEPVLVRPGEPIPDARASDLPPEHQRNGVVCIPVHAGPATVGAVAFGLPEAARRWPEDTYDLLVFAGTLLARTLGRSTLGAGLRASRLSLEGILDAVPDGIALLADDDRILATNASFAAELGMTRQACEGSLLAELPVPEEVLVAISDAVEQVRAQRRLVDADVTLATGRGTRWLHCRMAPADAFDGVVLTVRDLTRRHRAVADLDAIAKSLEQALQALPGALAATRAIASPWPRVATGPVAHPVSPSPGRPARRSADPSSVAGTETVSGVPPDFPGLARLTARERQVLDLLAAGLRVSSIAGRLYVSQSTVRNYVSGILRKSGVPTQARLLEMLVSGRS